MSIIEELNNQYERHDAALTLQHNLLIKSIGGIVNSFGSYLGITKNHWHDQDGRAGERYVRLGVGVPDKFEERMWQLLTSVGGVASFSVAVTLESEVARFRRFTYVFEGDARFGPEGYEYRFKDIEYPVFLSPEQVEAENFSDVHSVLVGELMRNFDPDSVLIKR